MYKANKAKARLSRFIFRASSSRWMPWPKPLVQTGSLPRGTETLLVVEDEPSVRHLACGVLQAQGYEVLSASNGQDALHVARGHKGAPIRLVVTDVIMPLMGGKVMAEWLRITDPGLKILFTSGYMDDAITEHGELEPGVAFLAKPYTPAMLACKVRQMLDEENDSSFLRKQNQTATDSGLGARGNKSIIGKIAPVSELIQPSV